MPSFEIEEEMSRKQAENVSDHASNLVSVAVLLSNGQTVEDARFVMRIPEEHLSTSVAFSS